MAQGLRASLRWWHLLALGVGAIVGTGILTLIGVGASKAGPAVLLAFIFAGLVSVCAALAYAEMAVRLPLAGGAYAYASQVMGPLAGWVVGWSLILEYSLVVSAVAVGWSGYAAPLLGDWFGLPGQWMQADGQGIFNMPALLIIVVVGGLLTLGTRESARLNAVLVVVKLAALFGFVVLAARAFDVQHLQPFMPYGFVKHVAEAGSERGVMVAAAVVFFAFYGFDALASAAEETVEPQRDLVIGIVGSMALCVLIYLAVGLAALGAMPFGRFADSTEPLALILRELGHPVAARWLGASAVIALPTVILGFFYGQSRIFFAMARDGWLPTALAQVSSNGTPVRIVWFTASIVGVIAGCFPLAEIAALANAGTLLAFATVAWCLLWVRRQAPDDTPPFHCPLPYGVAGITLLGCVYLFFSLPSATQSYFALWNGLGLCVYGLQRQRARHVTS